MITSTIFLAHYLTRGLLTVENPRVEFFIGNLIYFVFLIFLCFHQTSSVDRTIQNNTTSLVHCCGIGSYKFQAVTLASELTNFNTQCERTSFGSKKTLLIKTPKKFIAHAFQNPLTGRRKERSQKLLTQL